jgi:5-methylthioadenosine/S-adenosylhomocysteine deaminase
LSITILSHAKIICMDQNRTLLSDGHIVIRDGRIERITDEPLDYSAYNGAEIVNMSQKVILPGFFNAHTHIAMIPFRGIVHDRGNVLYDIIWPIERVLTAEDCYHFARLGALEALKSGNTTVTDHYFFMDEIAQGISSIGIRGVVGETVMDLGGPFASADSLFKGIAFWERWQKKDPMITPVLAPHGPDTVSEKVLREIQSFCHAHDTYYHMHVSQTQHEMDTIRERHGMSSVAYLNQIGMLGPRLAAAHCIYTNDDDVALLSATGSSVLYCPSTHAFTGYVAPAHAMVEAGVNVCLGTDYVAENDDHCMLEEMRLATMLQKVIRHDPQALPTPDVLAMATCNGPRAYGLGVHLGSLETGKAADLIAIDLKTPRLTPHFNLLNTIVYAAAEADIDTVMVNGQFRVRNKKVVGIDEDEIIRSAQEASDRILRKALEKRPALAGSIDSYILNSV